jgi:hypothetical protein
VISWSCSRRAEGASPARLQRGFCIAAAMPLQCRRYAGQVFRGPAVIGLYRCPPAKYLIDPPPHDAPRPRGKNLHERETFESTYDGGGGGDVKVAGGRGVDYRWDRRRS